MVLVHGAWHGAWCWDLVVAALAQRDIAARAVELPFRSFEDDVETTRTVIRAVGDSVILVGHSLGGGVVCAASTEPAVRYLGFVSAVALDAGETLTERLQRHGVRAAYHRGATPELAAGIRRMPDGSVGFDPSAAGNIFYNDCTADAVSDAVSRLRPTSFSSMTGTPTSGHRHVPSSFVFCTEDHAIPMEVQRAFAASLTGPHTTLRAAHSPFISQPGDLADVIAGWVHRLD